QTQFDILDGSIDAFTVSPRVGYRFTTPGIDKMHLPSGKLNVCNYYRLTKENRLLFGSATRFLEYTPHDFAAWNRTLLTEVFPYL
ncbi:hypothetical protein MJN51_32065, partial [Salmonella enterica subsp. enterica serovar Kentucky]|nr:hypothetical protein [Salmonella enterica subsp. enterica serovar Kentucky]